MQSDQLRNNFTTLQNNDLLAKIGESWMAKNISFDYNFIIKPEQGSPSTTHCDTTIRGRLNLRDRFYKSVDTMIRTWTDSYITKGGKEMEDHEYSFEENVTLKELIAYFFTFTRTKSISHIVSS